MSLSLSGAALALVLSAACGEVKGTNTPPDSGSNVDPQGDFTLTVDPTSLTIPIAGSAKVTVTVSRTGDTGDIALSATGLGSNLTAEFSPAAIPDGETTAEVTITVKGGTPAGTATVTVTGTAGDKTHSADVSVTSTTITVTGTVRGNRSGVTVGIIGKPEVTSGSGGTFTFTDVTPPYDLYTVAQSGCGQSVTQLAYVFDDLTRTDPVVSAASYSSTCIFIGPVFCNSPAPNSNVTGTKSGAGNNTDFILWSWSEGSFNNPVLNTNGSFSGNASWCFGNTSSGALHALQFTKKANGAPDTFLGYAKAQATYTSGSPAMTPLTFAAVGTTGTIAGTLNAPAGYPTPSVRITQQFGNVTAPLWQTNTTAIDAAFPVIASAGGTLLYATTTLNGVGTSTYMHPLTATATINFTMPQAAVLMTPANAATGITTSSPFAWTASPGVISQFNISSGGVAYVVYTTSDQATIPVLPNHELPAATSGTWSVTTYAPVASINDAAAADQLEGINQFDYTGPPHAISTSMTRTFTTQ